MNFRSFTLAAVALAVMAPAAFAGSSGDNSWMYRDKPNTGGALVTANMDAGIDNGISASSDSAAFAVIGGQQRVAPGAAGDYWPGKSGNGYN